MTARPTAWTVLALAAWLFAGCIVVQVFLAGLGVFDSANAFVTIATSATYSVGSASSS